MSTCTVLGACAASSAGSNAEKTEAAAPADAIPEQPNILLMLADDLGYGDLGSYGNRKIATPNLDRLAREGMRFSSFYTNGSTCTPTRLSLLTGRYPQRLGAYGGLKIDSDWGLPAGTKTLAHELRRGGYETVHVGKWHLGHVHQEHQPLAHGFERFFGFLHAHQLPKTYRNPRLRSGQGPEAAHDGHLTELLTDRAIAFLEGRTGEDRPFFLNLWYFSPHKPLQPPARWAERYADSEQGRYAAMVSSLDEAIGRLLKALEDRGLERETVVIFLSDNGGVWDLHEGRNGPLRGGKTQLFEGGIRAPLIVRWPGRVAAGSVSSEVTASFDAYPTLLEIAGVEPPLEIDGRSLLPVLEGDGMASERALFWEEIYAGRKQGAVRAGRWKLTLGGTARLFDLEHDPGEASDLATRYPGVVDRLRSAYGSWRSEMPDPVLPDPTAPTTER
ncbi:MAG: sulfatase [Acidobacteriota bacterium]